MSKSFVKYKNILKKKPFLLVILCLFSLWLSAQQTTVSSANGKITGQIIDSVTGQPVEYASISLSTQDVDKEINGMMTDDKGAFELTNIADGTYKLSIFSIGYKQGLK